MINTPNVKAQLLKKLAEDALNKALSSGVNKILKNSTVKFGQKVFVFEELNNANITQIGYTSNKTWNVYIESSTGGIQEYYSTVYWDREYQLNQNYKYRSNSHSFDLIRINDSCLIICHNIKNEPFNSEYPEGAKYDLFKIKDSVMYKKTVNELQLKAEIINSNLSSYDSIIKFSEGKIYNLEITDKSKNVLGTYKNYMPAKLNFIITSIYFREIYGKIDEALLTLHLMNLTNAQNDWLDKQKSCDECSKKFTGSAYIIESNKQCKIRIEDFGFSLLTGKWVDDTDNIFCSKKCAENFCIDLK